MHKFLLVGLVVIPLTSNLALAQTTPAAKASAPNREARENAMQKTMREACEDDPKACKKWRQKARERREAQHMEQAMEQQMEQKTGQKTEHLADQHDSPAQGNR